jgi:hypothetical protein
LQKEKTNRAISYRDSRVSALCADRRLVNKLMAEYKTGAVSSPGNIPEARPYTADRDR